MFFNAAMMTAATMAAANEIGMYKKEQEAFERCIAHLSDEDKVIAREKRRLERQEERRHRELINAIDRNTQVKQSAPSGIGMAGLIFGSCLVSGMINNNSE